MCHVSNSLLLDSNRITQRESKKLDKLCLILDELQFLHDVVNILAPIEKITCHISGTNYLTFSTIYLYIKILKKSFALQLNKRETKQQYFDLIYSYDSDGDNKKTTDNSLSSISDNDDTSSCESH
ncbi:7915_t:CDS:2 [Cetraspora pellucida]|uniref:7915_t:CDS:1 n=1 Tax=Cetraspora pellucida TaxID=1433469 RepID=A0ACA9K4I5_9GLOM|nr:7915_t:CDS:2 [Cetraspora pellucida]